MASILPDHLIIHHIFPRLPVKSLLRFKSLSKFWFSTLSSPIFSKSHLKYSSSCPQFLMLPQSHGRRDLPKFSFLHYHECDGKVKGLVQLRINDLYDHSGIRYLRVIGSCNGLVCLLVRTKIHSYLLLSNPATRQNRKIALPYFLAFRFKFFYVKSIDDYKIFFLLRTHLVPWVVDLFVFTLSTKRWKKIHSLSNKDAILACKSTSVLVDETLHFALCWAVRDIGHRVELNVATEEIKRIPCKLNWLRNYKSTRFLTIRGRLSLICMTIDGVFDAWMLKEASDWYSWEKYASLIANTDIRFLNLSPNGKGLFMDLKKLKVVDLTLGSPQLPQAGIDLNDWQHISKAHSYVESLIFPFVKSKDDGVEDEVKVEEMEI